VIGDCPEVICADKESDDPVTKVSIKRKDSDVAHKCAFRVDFCGQILKNIKRLVESPMLV
jgi:hypothetical protein